MDEITAGLWTWTAPHPGWTPEDGGAEGWERDVRSYAYDARDSLVLFDPLVSVSEIAELAAGRPVAVLLTCSEHGRSTADLVRELDATVHAPVATLDELGITALRYELGEDLPGDVEPQVAAYSDEAIPYISEGFAWLGAWIDGVEAGSIEVS